MKVQWCVFVLSIPQYFDKAFSSDHLQKYVFDYYCLIYINHLDLTVLQAAPIGALIGVVYGLLQTVRLL